MTISFYIRGTSKFELIKLTTSEVAEAVEDFFLPLAVGRKWRSDDGVD